jgi:hypothetical protein
MTMILDIDNDEKKKRFVSIIMEHVEDWKDNPTFKTYSWTDWSYSPLFYALKIQYRVCDPRLDKKLEVALLQKHEETHITMFRWPVPVPVDHVGPEGECPSRVSPSEILVYMRMASFCAKCKTMEDGKEIAESVLKWRK